MNLDIEFGSHYCYTRRFIINGIAATEEDFGEQYDRDPENTPDYGCDKCGNMQFTRVAPKPEVLEKYSLTPAEYALICDKLEAGLSFGRCSYGE